MSKKSEHEKSAEHEKPGAGLRTKVLGVRVTTAEFAELQKKARVKSQSLSNFAREALGLSASRRKT